MSALVEARDLVVEYPLGRASGRATRLCAIGGLSLSLERGRALGLVGESGCGKSSFLRALVGLAPLTSGSLTFDGQELVGSGPATWRAVRRRIGLVFQDPSAALDPRACVAEILMEPLVIARQGTRAERRARAFALADAVGLASKHLARYPHEFSGGQRQRIAIARALVLEPELLLLDEPTSSLDVSVQAQILNLLAELCERLSLALILVSHDLAVVRHLCDDVAVMYLGRLVEHATREGLFSGPHHPYARALLDAVPLVDPRRERARVRVALGGDPPSPLAPPEGCAFHPRCPRRAEVAGERCARETPVLSPLSRELAHASACHLPH